MIGVFDSGKGGLAAIEEIRRIAPHADICFFADKENSPYGTKSEKQLTELVKHDIEILTENGAESILMACCTASTVFHTLPEQMKRIATPIISPTARRAAETTQSGRIAVIATEATVRSGAFSKELYSYPSVKEVYEFKMQELVSLVEEGNTDGCMRPDAKKKLKELMSPLLCVQADTLILGCTHFPRIEAEIRQCLPSIKTVSSAKEGAIEILKNVSYRGTGKTVYI